MLKFIAKVWIAGEVSDFRRGYKRRKALKREARMQQRLNRMNEIARNGQEGSFNNASGKMLLSFLIAMLSMVLGVMLPLLWVATPIALLSFLFYSAKFIFIYLKNIIDFR